MPRRRNAPFRARLASSFHRMSFLGTARSRVSAAWTWVRRSPKNAALASLLPLAVAAAIAVPIATAGSPSPHAVATTTSTIKAVARVGPACPLTDSPAPGVMSIPARPALLVKIGNEPDGARPQSGLNEADIVFDTPAEGFIMRYVAVFQCQNAPAIGPTRSVRWVDWNMIAPEFRHPILAFAGGINPNANGVASSAAMTGANLLDAAQAAGHRITSRVAPDNLYTSSAAILSLFPSLHDVPQPIFDFNKTLPTGSKPAAALAINFSYGTDARWNWDKKTEQWLHGYVGASDIDAATNRQVTTTNIVVEIVHYQIGPYCESGCPGGSGDIESNLLGTGSGYVLRDGRVFSVTWNRPSLTSKTTFTDSSGHEVTLAPGRTWVEIVPSDVSAPVITP